MNSNFSTNIIGKIKNHCDFYHSGLVCIKTKQLTKLRRRGYPLQLSQLLFKFCHFQSFLLHCIKSTFDIYKVFKASGFKNGNGN